MTEAAATTETKPAATAAAATTETKPAATTTETKPAATTETKPATAETTLASAKPEETKPGETKPSAPEKYEPFKFPDGWQENKEVMDSATALFKEAGLSQDHAQKLIDIYSGAITKAQQASRDNYVTTRKGWHDEIRADKDIGSGNEKIIKPEVSASISKLIDGHLGGEKFREALNVTGAGDHPAVIRALAQVAKLLTEGGHVAGEPSKGDARQKTPGARLWPNLAKES